MRGESRLGPGANFSCCDVVFDEAPALDFPGAQAESSLVRNKDLPRRSQWGRARWTCRSFRHQTIAPCPTIATSFQLQLTSARNPGHRRRRSDQSDPSSSSCPSAAEMAVVTASRFRIMVLHAGIRWRSSPLGEPGLTYSANLSNLLPTA